MKDNDPFLITVRREAEAELCQCTDPSMSCRFEYGLLHIMDIDCAVLMAYLITKSYHSKTWRVSDGWFALPQSSIRKDLPLPDWKITRVMNRLRRSTKSIKIKVAPVKGSRSPSPVRHFQIDSAKLQEEVTSKVVEPKCSRKRK